jgi:hypothetical protein
MHPEILRALMNERVREARAGAVGRVRRRPRLLPRVPRPRPAWAAKAA